MNKVNYVVKVFLVSFLLFFCASVISLDLLMRALTDFNFIGSDFEVKNLINLSLFDLFPAIGMTVTYCRRKLKRVDVVC